MIASVLEKRAKKTGKMPLMTTFSVYNLARNNKFDSSKAKKELGYTTINESNAAEVFEKIAEIQSRKV